MSSSTPTGVGITVTAEPTAPAPTAADIPLPDPGRTAALLALPVLSAADVVEVGRVSLSTVRRAIDRGELPVRRIGRRVLIPTAAVLAWLAGDDAGNVA